MSDSPPPADPPPTGPRYDSATQGAAGTGAPSADGLARFFDGIRSLGIVRGDDRWFAGVLGGIAARTGIAPTALRIVVILFGVLGAPVLFTYVLAWALLPDPQGRIHAEQALRGVFELVIIAIVVLLIASFPPFGGSSLWRWPWRITGLPDWFSTMLSIIWGIAITIGSVWLIVYLVRQASSGPAAGSGWAATTGPTAMTAGSWVGGVVGGECSGGYCRGAGRRHDGRLRFDHARAGRPNDCAGEPVPGRRATTAGVTGVWRPACGGLAGPGVSGVAGPGRGGPPGAGRPTAVVDRTGPVVDRTGQISITDERR